jgi:hypothetical protein
VKTIVSIVAIFLFLLFSSKSNEIIGLDSLKIGNKIEILNLRKSVYTGDIDTVKVYVEQFETPNSDKPDYIIRYSDLPDRSILISNDSTFQLFDSTQEYTKFKSNVFEYINEISVLYNIIYRKKGPNSQISRFTRKLKVETTTEIMPNENVIYYKSKWIMDKNTYSITEIALNIQTFNRLEYKLRYYKNGDEEQLMYHYIFQKATTAPIFTKMEAIYKNRLIGYSPKELSLIDKKNSDKLEQGDTIDINYTLQGINRDDVYLPDYFKSNQYLIIYAWGTWCAPCLSNSKNVEKLYKDCTGSQLVTLMYEKGKANISEKKAYVKRKKPNYPVYSNEDFVKINNFSVYPTLIVINKEGGVVDIQIGAATDSRYMYDKIVEKYGK